MNKHPSPNEAPYINNPFYIALEGIELFFKRARSVAILAIVLCALSFVSNLVDSFSRSTTSIDPISSDTMSQDPSSLFSGAVDQEMLIIAAVVIGTILFFVSFIMVMVAAIFDYTSAQLAKGKSPSLGDAIRAAFEHFFSYLWVMMIVLVKIFLWSLLLIVPGIIMAIRYSLAGTSFFAEGKRGNEAVKRSLALTKDAAITVFSASALWNVMTLGLMTYFLQPGTNAVLYRQLQPLTDKGAAKPAAHILSWVTLGSAIALATMFILIFFAVILIFALTLARSFS